MNATQLRRNLYRTLDKVIETGESVEVERKGQILLIAPRPAVKQKRVFKKRDVFVSPGEDITKIDWMKEWRKNNKVSLKAFNRLNK